MGGVGVMSHKAWEDWSVCAGCGGTIHRSFRASWTPEMVWRHVEGCEPEGPCVAGHEARPPKHRAHPKSLHWLVDELADFGRVKHRATA